MREAGSLGYLSLTIRAAILNGQMKSFNDLSTPFRCVATDLVSAKQQVFDSGLLDQALRATMSIPGYFEPVLRVSPGGNTEELVDGGLVNNLPVDLVKAMGPDMLVSVNLSGFTTGDDSRAQEIMNRGLEGAKRESSFSPSSRSMM